MKSSRDESGGGVDGNHSEGGTAKCQACVARTGNPGKAPSYKQDTGEKHSAIRLELRVLENNCKISSNQLKVQGKVDSSQKHEENDNALDINIVKNTDASVMRRKPPRCDGGKRCGKPHRTNSGRQTVGPKFR